MNAALWAAIAIVVIFGLMFSGLAYWGTSLHRASWALMGAVTGVMLGLGAALLWLLLAWVFGWGG